MLIYLLLFFVFAGASLSYIHNPRFDGAINQIQSGIWLLVFIVLSLIIGFRYEVGGDWDSYLAQLNYQVDEPFSTVAEKSDIAYYLINWIGANMIGGIFLVNLICGALFSLGLITFSRAQSNPWLVMAISTPYLINVVAMGYTRQGVAVGLFMMAITFLKKGSHFRFLLWLFFAALFHKSAVFLAPIAIFILAFSKRWYISFPLACFFFILMYVFLLQDSVDELFKGYIESDYESSGTTIRVIMNAAPSIIFLTLRRRILLSYIEYMFWTLMAMGGIFIAGLLFFSPSSTAIDRIALYWIPIQLFVYSRLPEVFSRSGHANSKLVLMILLYSLVILLTWLLYAKHSTAWLPYRFYPWEMLWL